MGLFGLSFPWEKQAQLITENDMVTLTPFAQVRQAEFKTLGLLSPNGNITQAGYDAIRNKSGTPPDIFSSSELLIDNGTGAWSTYRSAEDIPPTLLKANSAWRDILDSYAKKQDNALKTINSGNESFVDKNKILIFGGMAIVALFAIGSAGRGIRG